MNIKSVLLVIVSTVSLLCVSACVVTSAQKRVTLTASTSILDEIRTMDQAALVELLKSPEGGKRLLAAHEIGARNLVGCLGSIQALFTDPAPRVRAYAGVAAFKLGDKNAAVILRTLLTNSDLVAASLAAEPLVSTGDAKALDVAQMLSKNENFLARNYAYTALWSSPNQDIAYGALAAALADSSDGIRWDAITALGKRHSIRAVEMLVAHLNAASTPSEERWKVARSIAKNDTWASVPVLIDLVTDSNPKIAFLAARYLLNVHHIKNALSASRSSDSAKIISDEWRLWWNQEKNKHTPDSRLPAPPTH